MAIRIVHASIDERGKISGGVAGNQTGKEVCIRNWYNKPWDYVLRFKDRKLAEKAVANAVLLAQSGKVGYDQNQRNTLKKELQKVNWCVGFLTTPCETDCSAFMSVVCESVGIAIPYSYGNAPTTRTMVTAFKATGFFEVLSSSMYTQSDKSLKKGDILVKEGSHTVMVIDDSETATDMPKADTVRIVYRVGQVYALGVDLFVRCEPKGEKKLLSELTASGKKSAYDDGHGYAILKKSTRVTCKDVKIIGNQTWLRIPSGWLCAIDGTKINIL